MSSTNILGLLGGLALFLYGMQMMSNGLESVAGNKMKDILEKLTSNRFLGIIVGALITAVIQSSSATTVMVVGFVNSGMMTLNQAVWIIMGANIGTTITGQLIALDVGALAPLIAFIGVALVVFSKNEKVQFVGEIIAGLGILFVGMNMMGDAMVPLREYPPFINLMTRFSNPLIGIIAGMIFTAVIQSSSASVGILQALAITGAVTFEVAFPIIMGIAIGAAVPVLLSALGANIHGRRTAFVYLLIDVLGVIIWASVFYVVNAFVHFPFMPMTMTTVTIALLNTLFRLATVIVLAPCIGLLERFVCFLIPDKRGADPAQLEMDRLEERFLQHPALAIEQSREVTTAMANTACSNLTASLDLISNYSDKGFQSVEDKENTIDRFEDKLGTYLMKITVKSLNTRQSEEVSKYLHTISDFERIGDHALNIAECAKEIHEKNIIFSEQAQRELSVLQQAIRDILHLSVDTFIESNVSGARRVEPLEEIVDTLCDEMKSHHIERLQRGVCTLNQGFVFNDLLTNFERVADHCSNIALAVIELQSDSFDTHEYVRSLKQMKDESFAEYYDEYKRKYSI